MTTKPCQWCGSEFESANARKLYCSPKCKNDFGNFMGVVGKRIALNAMVWRSKRGAKGVGASAMKDLCQMLDRANEDFRTMRPKGAPSISDHYVALGNAPGITRSLDLR